MNFVIISSSLLFSTVVSVRILKKKHNKWISLLSAIILNTLILIGATWVLYSLNDEAKIFGFGHSGLYVLLFAIPIITWINFLILSFIKKGL
ncbi:hypothetical protein [Ammoniphilus resinae]|uniref:Uncharacterized protein n=1 Tax=Ammoniphilus resinae TaxID=861532 RepID=A0ABS4GIU8_9BACL|nr:hypothetical protein [Ammoniphilus resinae]MBP1930180.1 hypothetical protein [Ammoniphilus resinae]